MEIPHLKHLYPEQLYNNDISDCDVIFGRRIDLTHLKVYTIDPPNCVDADDGFSIKFTECVPGNPLETFQGLFKTAFFISLAGK